MRGWSYLRQWMPVVLVCVTSVTAQPDGQVCINEFLASNSTSLADAEGHYDDWIELYNPGPASVDIAGMFLTDDLDAPTRWRIPDDRPQETILPAGRYVLIWADNDADGAALHANFKLSSEGEALALFDTDGVTLVDRVIFTAQSGDVSFGRYPDGTSNWAFMALPTPGAPNAEALVGIVANVTFSVEHGFCDEPFTVALTTETRDAQIWYTLDGTRPERAEDGSFDAVAYDEPIHIEGTTCIRAVAVKAGWKDSSLTSCTYIFFDGIPKQQSEPEEPPAPDPRRTRDGAGRTEPSQEQVGAPAGPELREALQAIASVCIVMEPNDFFDPIIGVNANPMGRGIEWERPASVEWVDPTDALSFQVNAGLRIHGGVSRNAGTPKHSLRLLFKGLYGPSTLNAPLFADSAVTEFDSLVLRGTLHDSWAGIFSRQAAQYLRDQFSRDTMRDMGRLTPYGKPVHAYINGLYWGLYILVERPDDGFAAAHLGGSKDQYDALKARSVSDPDSSPLEVVAGDLEAWDALFALAEAGLEDPARYDQVKHYLDLPSFIDYMLMIFYIGSTDGPVGLGGGGGGGTPRNFWAIRPREAEGGFVFLAWDLEFSLDNLNENRVPVTGTNNPHYLFHRLAANPDFRMSLADHMHRQFFFDGALTPERAIERYLARAADVERAVMAEAFRWNANGNMSVVDGLHRSWVNERDRLIEGYFPLRSDIVVDQLREAGLYPTTEPPLFEIDGAEQHGGPVRSRASLAIVNPNEGGTSYFTTDGSDPRMPHRAADVNELTILVAGPAEKRVLVPQEDIGDNWTGGHEPYDDAHWTDGTPVVPDGEGAVGYVASRTRDKRISYSVRSPMDGRTSCYIRIGFHVNAEALPNVSHLALRVRCDDGFVAYINGVEVASLNRPAELAWDSRCVDRPESEGDLWVAIAAGLNLLHPGENILAIHALDNGTDDFFLLSAELFASDHAFLGGDVAASAGEYSEPIELTESMQIKTRIWHAGQWSPLTEAVFAVGPVVENLRITEVMYHPPEPNEEFLELANVGTETINLNMVRFVDGIDFVFPSMELAPGEAILVVRDIDAFTDRYGQDARVAGPYAGALSNAGERVWLQDAIGRTIMDLRYDDAWYDSTDGQGYSLECRDPFHQDPNLCSDGPYWQPSAHPGGSPGILEDPQSGR